MNQALYASLVELGVDPAKAKAAANDCPHDAADKILAHLVEIERVVKGRRLRGRIAIGLGLSNLILILVVCLHVLG